MKTNPPNKGVISSKPYEVIIYLKNSSEISQKATLTKEQLTALIEGLVDAVKNNTFFDWRGRGFCVGADGNNINGYKMTEILEDKNDEN